MMVGTSPPQPRTGVLRRIGHFLWQTTSTQAVTVVVTVAVGAALAFVWGRVTAGPVTPAVDIQLGELRELATQHHETLFIRPASLHDGLLSYVVVSEEPTESSANFERSDDIQIYDLVAGRLKRVFDFRPSPHGHEGWRYRLDSIQDLENTGAQEVIGGLSLLIDSGGSRAFVPIIISWDAANKQYVIEPLLPGSPLEQVEIRHFHRFVGVGGFAWWQVEAEGVTIRDPRTGTAFHGYGGVDYIIRTVSSFRAPSGTGLVAVAVLGAVRDDMPVEALTGWIMNPTLPKVTVANCPAQRQTLHLVYGDLRDEIARAYRNSGVQC
jgi:hypothetical protein